MKRLHPLILLVLAAVVSGAEESPEPPETREARVGRIVREALATGGTYRMLGELCKAAPHRLSGSPGAAVAVEWARKRMVSAGFANVRLEPCRVPVWVRGDVESLRVVGPGAPKESLPILAIGGSVATPVGGVTAEVIEVSGLKDLEARAAAAKGRIVFFNMKMDATLPDPFGAYGQAAAGRVRGASAAAKAGAVAVVVRSLTTLVGDVPHTGGLRYEKDVPKIPAASVSSRGADRISALLAAGKPVSLHLELDCRSEADADSYNVVGELPGTEKPEEIVVVGGHLDSWDVGEGAHDDGAGCCQAIRAVELLKDLGLRPKRTLRVVLFMNEENGLRGGRAYAAAHGADLDRHVMALESDRGAFTPRGFKTNANPAALAILREIASALQPIGAGKVGKGGGGADISPMGPSGVVLVGYVPDPQRYFDYHHCARDTFSEINERELELGTAAIAALIHEVADLEERLPAND